MSQFLMELVHLIAKKRVYPGAQTALTTTLQVKDVNKMLLW